MKWRDWIFYAVMLFWIVPAIIYYIGASHYTSENDYLRRELIEYRTDIWGKFHRSIWIKGNRLSFRNPTGDSVFNFYILPDCPDSIGGKH